ncbi:guanylate kinase [Acidipila sp. EB88]|uniref:guanylate kinase n=1 Tax=Acidipila sp. EB88 TaxID=2305226 RepID=UPI000F5E9E5B|nr:guanylate kinase [Acidipila sp. EB88]RRA49217.1 guanylate kinase [Acidipila sp. EB88]
MAGILYIISAPSGSGKSTLVAQIRSLVADLEFSVSYTTRAPRGSEESGREYHFISVAEFERMIAEDAFMEYADVFGNYYGTARKSLTDATAHGKDLLLDIDVQGAEQVRMRMPEAVTIFVLPPTPEILEARLRNRSRAEGLLDDAVIARRLAKARSEIGNYDRYRYVLLNDVLDIAVDELSAIVAVERVRATPAVHSDHEQQLNSDLARLETLAAGCRQQGIRSRLAPVLAAFGIQPDRSIATPQQAEPTATPFDTAKPIR